MEPGTRGEIALGPLPCGLVADEELFNDAMIVGWIELVGAIDQGFHLRLLGHQFRTVFGKRDRSAPGHGSPIEEWNILFLHWANRSRGMVMERRGKTGMLCFEAAQ